jgi:NAD-dependent DNA ligase
MPSDKVTRILKARTDLPPERLAEMSEAEAWRLVYSLPGPEKSPTRVSVCFTGFSTSDKKALWALADAANHHVTPSVTKSLGVLVCGANAGPKKLEKAAQQGVALMTESEYREFVCKPGEG